MLFWNCLCDVILMKEEQIGLIISYLHNVSLMERISTQDRQAIELFCNRMTFTCRLLTSAVGMKFIYGKTTHCIPSHTVHC